MKKLLVILGLGIITACSVKEVNTMATDQCLRQEIFNSCLANVPSGPANTKYNDWAEVVNECGTQAYYLSRREIKSIKEECKVL